MDNPFRNLEKKFKSVSSTCIVEILRQRQQQQSEKKTIDNKSNNADNQPKKRSKKQIAREQEEEEAQELMNEVVDFLHPQAISPQLAARIIPIQIPLQQLSQQPNQSWIQSHPQLQVFQISGIDGLLLFLLLFLPPNSHQLMQEDWIELELGLYFLSQVMTIEEQLKWAKKCLSEYSQAEHTNLSNLHGPLQHPPWQTVLQTQNWDQFNTLRWSSLGCVN